MVKHVAIVLGFLFLFACATAEIGQQFNKSAAEQIQIGKTTEAELISMLGRPLKERQGQDGVKVYTYGYIKSQATAVPFASKGSVSGDKLIVVFDKKGIVSSIEKGSLPER
ncbi:MAG: outer membrane protein assembly factor BamE [Deltaproteobacteria bacterium]|nr:outer membrane protein assembly factor BamE [Deltaproteobacteria bacterium]